jgi:serine/threonine-protein kinase
MNLSDGYFLQRKKYRLTRTIGQGGFGITYLAVWNTEVKGELGAMKTNVPVCIKEYFFKDYCYREKDSCSVKVHSITGEKLFSKFKEKLIEEANILSAVHHPYIVNVLEVFEENNTAYIVMEYIKGCSLKYMLESEGSLPENRVIKYIHQIGNALDFVHKKNVVHLDIKPGNILIDREDNARLIDFGVSKRYDIEEQETSTTTLTLSKGFASIEQYDNESMLNFSPCPDIYSLGATMYNLLTNTIPVESILRATKKLLPPTSYNATITLKTEQVILKAMEVRPENRYQTVRELLASLDAPTYELSENNLTEEKHPAEEDLTETLGTPDSQNPAASEDEDDRTIIKPANESGSTTSRSKTKKRSRRKRKMRRRAFLAAAILFFAIIGYATYSYIYDYQTFQGLFGAIKLSGIITKTSNTHPTGQTSNPPVDDREQPPRNQSDITSDIKLETDSSSVAGLSEPDVSESSQNDLSQPQNIPPQSQTVSPQTLAPNNTPVSTSSQGTPANSNPSGNPSATVVDITEYDDKFQRFMTSGNTKMKDGNYSGAIQDFEEAHKIEQALSVMGYGKDRTELDTNLRTSREQAKIERLDKYEIFFKFGELTIAKDKVTNKFGAIDDDGIEIISCIYRTSNVIRGMDNQREFIREDGLADIWDNTGILINPRAIPIGQQ